jgi:hypothetical protein
MLLNAYIVTALDIITARSLLILDSHYDMSWFNDGMFFGNAIDNKYIVTSAVLNIEGMFKIELLTIKNRLLMLNVKYDKKN